MDNPVQCNQGSVTQPAGNTLDLGIKYIFPFWRQITIRYHIIETTRIPDGMNPAWRRTSAGDDDDTENRRRIWPALSLALAGLSSTLLIGTHANCEIERRLANCALRRLPTPSLSSNYLLLVP